MAERKEMTPQDESCLKVLSVYHKATESEFDKLSPKKKAFIEASKAFSMVAAAGSVGLCMFGVSLAYLSKQTLHANTDTNSSSSSSTTAPKTPSQVQEMMLVATFFVFLYTSCTAALAHATVECVSFFKSLRFMIHLEVLLLSAIGGAYIYMLTESIEVHFVIFFPVVTFFFICSMIEVLF